jgi:hypothetical protein
MQKPSYIIIIASYSAQRPGSKVEAGNFVINCNYDGYSNVMVKLQPKMRILWRHEETTDDKVTYRIVQDSCSWWLWNIFCRIDQCTHFMKHFIDSCCKAHSCRCSRACFQTFLNATSNWKTNISHVGQACIGMHVVNTKLNDWWKQLSHVLMM